MLSRSTQWLCQTETAFRTNRFHTYAIAFSGVGINNLSNKGGVSPTCHNFEGKVRIIVNCSTAVRIKVRTHTNSSASIASPDCSASIAELFLIVQMCILVSMAPFLENIEQLNR
jgi:hypothetical protein